MPAQELGRHPDDGEPVTAAVGAYGPYVRHQALNASLPKVVLLFCACIASTQQLRAVKEAAKVAGGHVRHADLDAQVVAKVYTVGTLGAVHPLKVPVIAGAGPSGHHPRGGN